MVNLSAGDWICIFVFWLHQGATGSWMWLGLIFRWFCLCEFSLLPRVSSLVVSGLGVSVPTPKAQGLISELSLEEQTYLLDLVIRGHAIIL